MSKKQDAQYGKGQNQEPQNNQQEQILEIQDNPEASYPPIRQQQTQPNETLRGILPGSSAQQLTMRTQHSLQNSGISQNRGTGSYSNQLTNPFLNEETEGELQNQQQLIGNQSLNWQQQSSQHNQQSPFYEMFSLNQPYIDQQVTSYQFQPTTTTNILPPQFNLNPQSLANRIDDYGYYQQQNPFQVDFQQQDQQPRQLNTYQPLTRNPFIEVPNNQTLITQQVEGIVPQQNQQEQWQVSNQQHFNDEQVYGQEQSQFQEHLEQNEYHHLSSPITFGGHQQSEIPLQKSSKQQQQSVENNEEEIQEIRPREIDTSRVLINNQLQQQQQPDQKWSLFNLGKRQSKKKHKPSMNTNALESEIKSLTEQDKRDNSQIQSNNEGTKQVQDHLSQPSDEKEYEYQIILQDQSENPEKRLLQTYTYNVGRKNNISKIQDTELLKDYKFNVGVRLINSKTRRTAKNVHPISVKFQVCCSQTPYLPISSEFIKGERLITLLNGVCTFENLSISDISSRYEGSAFRFVIEATNEKVQKQQVPGEQERGDDNNTGTIGQRTSQRNQLLFKQKIQQAGNQKKEEEDDGEIVDVVIHPSQIKSHIIEKVLVKAWKKE